uniref:Hypothetical conserved protein n=2 Tax=Candidatus Bipolaricaulota TaxID=67810 RepID=H5S914_9BACT|nr:hypothetical conserved protein [uncultured Acetothermia bacterium]BAL56625.1 hypothetical conserved protein [uncultured Acetothermia bacterium]BAL59294.1 hypothetical conserved protein [Candidatus Acetothermum autotrophicum]
MADSKYKLPAFTEQIQELLEQGGLAQSLAQDPLLHGFKSLVIASDYSGESSGSKVRTYTFLLSGFPMLQEWCQKAQSFRKKRGVGLMEYKELKDRKRQRALPDWLSLLNCISGHLIIVTIDRSLPSVFGSKPHALLNLLQSKGFDAWDKNDIEKLLRILHLVGLLMKHATHPKQNFLWLSDRDSIIGDPKEEDRKLQQLLDLFPHVANVYVRHELGKIRIAVPSKDKPDSNFEEIITIPDLACGAVNKWWSTDPYEKQGKKYEAIAPIYEFLNEEHSNLKKHCFYIQQVKVQGGDTIQTSLYKFLLRSSKNT